MNSFLMLCCLSPSKVQKAKTCQTREKFDHIVKPLPKAMKNTTATCRLEKRSENETLEMERSATEKRKLIN